MIDQNDKSLAINFTVYNVFMYSKYNVLKVNLYVVFNTLYFEYMNTL